MLFVGDKFKLPSTHHSITCRIEKEYGIKQWKLIVEELIQQMILPVELATGVTLLLH
jgi:hypothetical protein